MLATAACRFCTLLHIFIHEMKAKSKNPFENFLKKDVLDEEDGDDEEDDEDDLPRGAGVARSAAGSLLAVNIGHMVTTGSTVDMDTGDTQETSSTLARLVCWDSSSLCTVLYSTYVGGWLYACIVQCSTLHMHHIWTLIQIGIYVCSCQG